MVSAGNESTCYGTRVCGSDHHRMLVTKEIEEIIIQRDGWNLGSVCTDNAGKCSRARRILQLRHSHLHFESCQAHQMVMIVSAQTKS